jgi:hypothetical protein
MNRVSSQYPFLDRVLRVAALAGLLLLFGGCATTKAPVEQIKFFSQAFTAVNTIGQPLLDDLAIAERAVNMRQAVSRAKKDDSTGECSSSVARWTGPSDGKLGFIDGYCLSDATYFSSLGDPLSTAQLRGGLRVIERYAEVLTTLAEGRNLDQALGEVDALGQEVSGLVALTGASVVLAPALAAIKPVLANVAQQANAEEARRLIIDGTPKITELISALRLAAPEMFKVLIAGPRRDLDNATDETTAATVVKAVELRRTAVSDYVVLLGRLQQAWDATAAAARNPSGSKLTDLVAQTARLRSDADAVRKTLAALRAGDSAQ